MIRSSNEVPRVTVLKRFPVPRNFCVLAESRIKPVRAWPTPKEAVRTKRLEIYRYDPDSGVWLMMKERHLKNIPILDRDSGRSACSMSETRSRPSLKRVGTPYVARFFPRERRGFAMGVFGAGTIGAAVNMFVAPALISNYGWQVVPRFYAIVLLITAGLFWLLSAPDPGAGRMAAGSTVQQLAVLKDPRVWKYCQYYSIVFGGFTALSVWMPNYFRSEYGFSIGQAALLAACFSLPGGAFRALGGFLADRFSAHDVTWSVLWVAWICLFLLSYPKTELIIHTIDGQLRFSIAPPSWFFTGLLFLLGFAFAFGMASTFKYIGDEFPDSIGAVSGIVGTVGGLGGFLLPTMFGTILQIFRFNSSCFMLLYGIIAVSLLLNYLTEIRKLPVMGERMQTGASQNAKTSDHQPIGDGE